MFEGAVMEPLQWELGAVAGAELPAEPEAKLDIFMLFRLALRRAGSRWSVGGSEETGAGGSRWSDGGSEQAGVGVRGGGYCRAHSVPAFLGCGAEFDRFHFASAPA